MYENRLYAVLFTETDLNEIFCLYYQGHSHAPEKQRNKKDKFITMEIIRNSSFAEY